MAYCPESTMTVNRIAWIGLTALMAFAPLTAITQTFQAAAPAIAASAVPSTGAGVGSNAARARHRATLNRQRARSTAEHARRVRATPRH
jgi:hypothetical protein